MVGVGGAMASLPCQHYGELRLTCSWRSVVSLPDTVSPTSLFAGDRQHLRTSSCSGARPLLWLRGRVSRCLSPLLCSACSVPFIGEHWTRTERYEARGLLCRCSVYGTCAYLIPQLARASFIN
jgi:hypothetical protein